MLARGPAPLVRECAVLAGDGRQPGGEWLALAHRWNPLAHESMRVAGELQWLACVQFWRAGERSSLACDGFRMAVEELPFVR